MPPATSGSHPITLPELRGRDLDGRVRRLPKDVPVDPCLVIFGFEPDDQRVIDTWLAAFPDEPVLEVPLIPRALESRRRTIEGGMADEIPDPDVRARTWCVYTHVDRTLAALGVEGRDEIVAAVVRRDGTILALERGPATPTKARRVLNQLLAAA